MKVHTSEGILTPNVLTEISQLVTGLSEAHVPYVSTLKEFSERQNERREVELLMGFPGGR